VTTAPEEVLRTRFTDLVGCRLPIQLAAMGGVSTVALAAAVASEGGLGMLAGVGIGSDDLAGRIHDTIDRSRPSGRVGIGFLMPFLDVEAFEAAAPLVPLIECFYGDPDAALVERAHDAGALMAWQIGSVDEALSAVDAGCDLVVVQGVEAGGHVRGDRPLMPLLGEVRDRVDVPLVAAGGIGTGGQVVAALDAGADAVRIGTRFLAAAEADVHPAYLGALTDATAGDTEVTEAFSAAWPHAPHRVLRSCIGASDDPPETRFPLPPTRDFAGDVGASALYAGTSVSAVDGPTTVDAIITELVAGMTAPVEAG